MPTLFPLKYTLLTLAVLGGGFLPAEVRSSPKFVIQGEQILITPRGRNFIREVASRQVSGNIRKITRKEAYVWIDKFVKLSNKKAQARADFTPLNNLMNHLVLCDELLNALIVRPGEAPPPARHKTEEIPEKRKLQLLGELEKLRTKMRDDASELVHRESLPNFKVMVDFYDKALRETLDINQASAAAN